MLLSVGVARSPVTVSGGAAMPLGTPAASKAGRGGIRKAVRIRPGRDRASRRGGDGPVARRSI